MSQELFDRAQFVLEQAKLNLESRIGSGDLLVSKSYDLLNLNIVLLTAELGGAIALLSSSEKGENTSILAGLLVVMSISGLSCISLLKNLSARKLLPIGNHPKALQESNFYGQDLPLMLLGEANTYEARISEAVAFNESAASRIDLSLKLSVIAPALAALLIGAWSLLYR